MTDQEAKTRAKELVDKCGFSDLTTIDENGFPQSRAMMPVLVDADLTTYYITHRLSAKCRQAAVNPKASSFWSEVVAPMADWRSVLVKGVAEVTDEKALRDKFWMEQLKPFFPGGADDPNFVIVIVRPAELILSDSKTMPALVVKLYK